MSNTRLLLVVATIVTFAIQASRGEGQPQEAVKPAPAKQDVKPVADSQKLQEAKEQVESAEEQQAKVQQLLADLEKGIDRLPPGFVDPKADGQIWKKLGELLPHLKREARWFLNEYPHYSKQVVLLTGAYDRAEASCLQAAAVCEQDAKTKSTDTEKEDFRVLSSILRKQAGRMRQYGVNAEKQKTEIAKYVKACQEDLVYLERLEEVARIVRVPFDQAEAMDAFTARVKRYMDARQQLRKVLRDFSEKGESFMPPPMGGDGGKKISSVAPSNSKGGSLNGAVYATAARENSSAEVSIRLPAGAKLFIDGKETGSTSDRCVFRTPPLEPGGTYYYVLRAEVIRNGRTISDTRQVRFTGGQTVNVSFADLGLSPSTPKAVTYHQGASLQASLR